MDDASVMRLARLRALAVATAKVLEALADELDGEARERVELAARVVAWECDRALEAGLTQAHLDEAAALLEKARRGN